LIEQGVVFGNETTYIHKQNKQEYPMYLLDYRNTMVVVSGYSVELRARIIDRWQELEKAQSIVALPDFNNPAEAARAWAIEYEAKQLALAERDAAIATKAEIGCRREATAINTASQAVKKLNKLEVELDKSKDYASVKRMEILFPEFKPFNWRELKATSQEMGFPIEKVFDQNYGNVNAYHKNVWKAVYNLDFDS